MSHHSGYPFQPKFTEDIGATGEFPNGKINEDDQGQIKIGITTEDRKIIVAFGKPVEWIGFTRDEAISLCNSIMERAFKI